MENRQVKGKVVNRSRVGGGGSNKYKSWRVKGPESREMRLRFQRCWRTRSGCSLLNALKGSERVRKMRGKMMARHGVGRKRLMTSVRKSRKWQR